MTALAVLLEQCAVPLVKDGFGLLLNGALRGKRRKQERDPGDKGDPEPVQGDVTGKNRPSRF
jgi:hypothetical protein